MRRVDSGTAKELGKEFRTAVRRKPFPVITANEVCQ